MADRIRQYMKYVDNLLESEDGSIDWDEEMKKHLVQIAFFAHERFIHLIVTVLLVIFGNDFVESWKSFFIGMLFALSIRDVGKELIERVTRR